jgi:hypothetical protein
MYFFSLSRHINFVCTIFASCRHPASAAYLTTLSSCRHPASAAYFTALRSCRTRHSGLPRPLLRPTRPPRATTPLRRTAVGLTRGGACPCFVVFGRSDHNSCSHRQGATPFISPSPTSAQAKYYPCTLSANITPQKSVKSSVLPII